MEYWQEYVDIGWRAFTKAQRARCWCVAIIVLLMLMNDLINMISFLGDVLVGTLRPRPLLVMEQVVQRDGMNVIAVPV